MNVTLSNSPTYFFSARIALLPHGLDSNVNKLLANLLINQAICILLFYQLYLVI